MSNVLDPLSFNKKYKKYIQPNYLGFPLLKTRLYSGTLIFHSEVSKIRKKISNCASPNVYKLKLQSQRFSNCYCEKGRISISSLLDNVPNYLVGYIIQKRNIFFAPSFQF